VGVDVLRCPRFDFAGKSFTVGEKCRLKRTGAMNGKRNRPFHKYFQMASLLLIMGR
jgi:transposase